MKKILLLLSLLAAILPTFAQHVRNKPFDPTLNPERLTPDEIIGLFGKPEQIDSALIDDGLGIFYPEARFYFYESYDPARPEKEPVYVWDGFETESPDFCILSDCFPGGIKVGDRLERLKQLDFVHSRYGKGRAKNGLRLAGNHSELDEYIIFGEEYNSFYLHVKDGIVRSISWVTPEDWGRIEKLAREAAPRMTGAGSREDCSGRLPETPCPRRPISWAPSRTLRPASGTGSKAWKKP